MVPLNPLLYQALVAAAQAGRFGHRHRSVRVIRQGQRNVKSRQFDVRNNRYFWKVENEGEVYLVCCPFCGDTRHRLNINHEWGVYDANLNTHNYFLANCFNELCHKQDFFLEQLKYKLQLSAGVSFHLDTAAPVALPRPKEYRSPGLCEPMHELCRRDPGHRAVQLLAGRGFNPELLGYYWGVSFCHHGLFPFTQDRIIFPVVKDGKPVGWQARYVGPDGKGKVKGLYYCYQCGYYQTPGDTKLDLCPGCGKEDIRTVPKYWTMPGMSTSENALNWDVAKTWPFIAATEGPLDPIRMGTPDSPDVPGPGICCFGHTLSSYHRRLILESGKPLVLLYDQDVWETTIEIAKELQGFISYVLPVPLPQDEDPGSLPHRFLWDTIRYYASVSGINLGV